MVNPHDAGCASASRIVTGGTEQTALPVEPQLPACRVAGWLEDMPRRCESGAPPPVGARELLKPRTRRRVRKSRVIWGVVFLAIVGYALSRIAPPSSVTPRQGAFVGNAPQGPSRFQISFSVSGSAIRNTDIVWQARCRSGKEWDDHALSPYVPLSHWTLAGQDYVTANVNGITEHVHVIEDTGHFIRTTRAAGVFGLSVVLDENGRHIDTCETGTIRWTARAG